METVGERIHTKKHTSHRTLWLVYFALLGLLAATVAVAYVPMGWFNLIVAAVIALVKAGLVVWYFMHLRESHLLVGILFGASLFMMMVAVILSSTDYLTRF